MRPGIIVLLILLNTLVFCQDKTVLRGSVSDQISQQILIGATIYPAGSNSGCLTNEKGFFSLTLKPGIHIIVASYLGYRSDTIEIDTKTTSYNDFQLKPASILAEEIVVTAKNKSENVTGIETGEVSLTMRDIKQLPALMGEADFMRVIQLTPGVSAANDGNSGFYVRGGGADQNLILFDNATVYNPSHVLGFFSIFNARATSGARLIKSGMPAEYGGRLSSIVSFTGQEGKSTRHTFHGNIGLLSTSLSVDGPLAGEKLTYLLAARRSYIDEVLKPAMRPLVNEGSNFYNYSKYHFYDLNLKLSFKPGLKDKITLTAYKGADKYSLEEYQLDFNNKMSWGNAFATLNWTHSFDQKWVLHTNLSLTEYNFTLDASQRNVVVGFFSGVSDASMKMVLSHAGEKGSIIKTGFEHTYHHFRPNNLSAESFESDLNFGSNRELNSHESALFYNHEMDLIPPLRISAGLRYTHYMHVGPYYQTLTNEINEPTDTLYYAKNKLIKSYDALEPRVSIRYQLNRLSSVKASYTYNNQFIHMASASTVTLPTDVWLPSTATIKPQKGSQYSIGYYHNLKENMYSTSLVAYYKSSSNQIELLQGFINNFQDNIFEESIVFGKGDSYGTELHLQKNMGKFTGWLGYTLSKTTREFEEINEGYLYPAKYDRRHDINLAGGYDLSEKLNLSATFIFATGTALTLPAAKYVMEGNVIIEYGPINSFRMPDYHRLDLSLTYTLKDTEKRYSALNFSVFNVYNRANPFYIFFEISGNVYDGNVEIIPKQISLFPILPSLSWNFKF